MASAAGHDGVDYRRALEGLLGVPATEGNQLDVLRNGDQIFPAMLDAIRNATRTADFLTFIYWQASIGEEFAEALADRAENGVRVRVLLDALGAQRIERGLIARMSDAGAQVEWFRPVGNVRFWDTNHRTHRKVLICDEEVAFTGGVGIADEWRGDARSASEWRDTHFRIRGPAVDGLRAAFLDNWAEVGGSILDPDLDRFPEQPQTGRSTVQVVQGSSEVGWSELATVVRALLLLARAQVRVTTAYFVPDDETCELLCDTARRGVEVTLLVPGPHADKRFVQLATESQYKALLDAGVEVLAYQPTMLHAKVMTVDGAVANIGSANFNSRSFRKDEEVNLVVFDPEVVEVLDAHFEEDRRRAQALDASQWEDRGVGQRVKEAATSVLRREL